MTDLDAWLAQQARREGRAVRLEDALLGGRHAAYFVFRLRFFVARTAIEAVLHAVKVALLLVAFPRDQFVAIIALGAALAVAGDFWWGALERMRGRIRVLQRDGSGHLVPREIAAWLRLSRHLMVAGVGAAVAWAAWLALLGGGIGPAGLYATVLLGSAAVGQMTRTFHSGAYATRRVYRPLPSLVAVDAVSVVMLLLLSPLLGLWAFPVAELVSAVVVVGVSLHYTARTYRVLGHPTLAELLRSATSIPSGAALRASLAPGLAYALIGLESLVILVVVAAGGAAGSTLLLALLAAIGPVIRAGYEWARLLYFDLVRLEVPVLADLRRRFDRAVLGLALVVGLATWAIAVLLWVVLMGVREPGPAVSLLAFLLARSLLAAAQVRAFVAAAYRRVAVVGAAGAVGSLLALVVASSIDVRLLLVAAVLGVSFLVLQSLPEPRGRDERVLPLIELLARLRAVPAPVRVTRARLDRRHEARGVTVEARRAEAWRQRVVARRLGTLLSRQAGAVAWWSGSSLVAFQPASSTHRSVDDSWLASIGAGLIVGVPEVTDFAGGALAARALAAGWRGAGPAASQAEMLAAFRKRFPGGIVAVSGERTPPELAAVDSRTRAAMLRAALRFARDLAPDRDPPGWEVTALVEGGRLRAMFLVDRSEPARRRREWAAHVAAWDVSVAAGGGGMLSSAPRGRGRTRRLSRPPWLRTMGCR